jgi:cytoskeletal protein RodZ
MATDPASIVKTASIVVLVIGGLGLVCFAAYKVWKQKMDNPNSPQPTSTAAVTQDFSAKYAAMEQSRTDLTLAEELVLSQAAALADATTKRDNAAAVFNSAKTLAKQAFDAMQQSVAPTLS